MRPRDIQQIGNELAVKWDEGAETYLSLEKMRRHCPCAGCHGETDVMGNVYKAPAANLGPKSFQLLRLNNVGGYAINPVWADGHSTGIYAFDYLKRLGEV